MKFKIGDIVRVRRDAEDYYAYTGVAKIVEILSQNQCGVVYTYSQIHSQFNRSANSSSTYVVYEDDLVLLPSALLLQALDQEGAKP